MTYLWTKSYFEVCQIKSQNYWTTKYAIEIINIYFFKYHNIPLKPNNSGPLVVAIYV